MPIIGNVNLTTMKKNRKLCDGQKSSLYHDLVIIIIISTTVIIIIIKQAGTTCRASSQADLTQNLVLKTRMLRF